MAKTIIQTIGPLYGEVENGTVFGRPNGSIYVPPTNTITISLVSDYRFVKRNVSGTSYFLCDSSGVVSNDPATFVKVVAESQDIANYVVLQISDSSDFTTLLDDTVRTAGIFNESIGSLIFYSSSSLTAIVNGQDYYFRAMLMSSNAEPVAVSDTIILVGVAE